MSAAPTESLEIAGARLEVRRIAAPVGAPPGPALVFLHEGLGSVALWRDWPATLCARLGLAGVVYSRQGYGASQSVPDVRGAGRLSAGYMHREALGVLPGVLSACGIERPVLVGHSDGGTIALIHAAHHPVTACVVMAPHVKVEDISLRSIEEARVAFESGELRARLARFHDDIDVAFWQWNDVWLSPGFRDFDIRLLCRAIEAPVLAIQGEDDVYGTMAQIDEIEPAGVIERVKLAHCGHSPHRDQPEAVNEAIAGFLARQGR